LRRQARDLLDEIPAAELPTALVFLQFLRERGAALLLGTDKADSSRGPSSAGVDSHGPDHTDNDQYTPEPDPQAK
jgi:hypothetical protein